jgi:hypothetical protein
VKGAENAPTIPLPGTVYEQVLRSQSPTCAATARARG